jgi:hypothetical protein
MPDLKDMTTWTERLRRTKLRTFTDAEVRRDISGTCRTLPSHRNGGKSARSGHAVAWEFYSPGGCTGRMLVDGEFYTPAEATKKFIPKEQTIAGRRD